MLIDSKFLFELIDDIPVGIARADTMGELPNQYNKFFSDMFGWTKEDLPTIDDWFEKAYPDDAYREELLTIWAEKAKEAEATQRLYSTPMEANITCRDGSQKVCEVRYYRKDNFIFGIFLDVTEHHRTEKKLEELSLIDDLTQLHNRKSYNERVNELLTLNKRYKTTFSILMLDIDDFKKVNDSCGHTEGDKVLVSLSELVKSHIRSSDYIFRVGGEEFIILFSETTLKEAHSVAEKIRNSVEYDLETIADKKTTISIGLTEVRHNDSCDCIFNRVDALMYQSKEKGKNRISFE